MKGRLTLRRMRSHRLTSIEQRLELLAKLRARANGGFYSADVVARITAEETRLQAEAGRLRTGGVQ